MGFNPGGGGSGSIGGSSDVALSNPANNDVLAYDISTSKWKNAPVHGGGNTSTTTVTTDTTAQAGQTLLVDTASSDVTITLPAPQPQQAPIEVIKVSGDAHQITIVCSGATFNGNAVVTTDIQFTGATFIAYGSNYVFKTVNG